MMSNQPGDGDDDRETEEGGQSPNNQPQGGQPPNNQPQGGQPPNNQPQGGQPPNNQPQGGQPPNNQPQGGQPPNNQPQGGQYPGGQQQQYRGGRGPPQQAGTGVGDIFNREDTKNQIIQGIVLFAAIGVGLGLIVILSDALADQRAAGWGSGPLLAPIVAVLLAQNHTDTLAEIEDSLAYATTAVTVSAGTIVLSLLTWISAEIVSDSEGFSNEFVDVSVSTVPDLGDALLVWVATAIGVAVIGLLILAVDRNL
jgi:hypothetical protein